MRPTRQVLEPWLLIAALFVVGAVVDYLVPPTYVMTPIYTIPILFATWRFPPRSVLAIAVLANLINLGSALLQDTPRQIWLFYCSGLVVTGALAVVAARQRQGLAHRARAIEIADRRLAVQLAVARSLAEAGTLPDGILHVLRSIGGSLDWSFGAFWRVDESANTLACVQTWHDSSAAILEFISLTGENRFPSGVGLPGRVWVSGKPDWICDVALDSNFPRAALAASVGLHGAFGFPVRQGGRVLGAMEFLCREVRELDRELLAMMDAIGSQIGQFMERERLRSLAEQRAEQIAEVTRLIAHDIRQPLTVMQGQTQMMRRALENGDLERARSSGEVVQVAVQRLNAMILDLARAARARVLESQLERRPIELAAAVNDFVRRMIEEGDVRRVRLEASEPVVALADPNRLDRILGNLLTNAFKYSEPGTPIVVRIAPGDGVARISIENRGAEIAPGDLSHLFEQGFRAETTRQVVEGSGLGLYSTRLLVEAHGGRIWAESAPSGVTTFSFTLPLVETGSQ